MIIEDRPEQLFTWSFPRMGLPVPDSPEDTQAEPCKGVVDAGEEGEGWGSDSQPEAPTPQSTDGKRKKKRKKR